MNSKPMALRAKIYMCVKKKSREREKKKNKKQEASRVLLGSTERHDGNTPRAALPQAILSQLLQGVFPPSCAQMGALRSQ